MTAAVHDFVYRQYYHNYLVFLVYIINYYRFDYIQCVMLVPKQVEPAL
jgi:hypothetical protein